MDIFSLIVSIIGTGAGVYALYTQTRVSLWFSILIGTLIAAVIVYTFIRHLKRRAKRYATIRLGLEFIRLIYAVDSGKRLRVSYFEKKWNRLHNIARVPYGTALSKVKFRQGEGFAGILWKEYETSSRNVMSILALPSAENNQKLLIEEYEKRNTNLSEKKILLFKKDVRSYLILALVHPISEEWLGAVCLDSTDPFEFGADEEAEDLNNLELEDAELIVEKIAKALYDTKGGRRRR